MAYEVVTIGPATLYRADCLRLLPALDSDSIDSIVTDPPYALTSASRNGSPRINDPETPFGRTQLGGDRGFMGKTWDNGKVAHSVELWREALRVAKPGAHLLAFGGTRTFHRLACAIEDAGWEIRDCVMWVYGSGFPKSLDVSKAIDKAAGAERKVVGPRVYADGTVGSWRVAGSDKYAQDEWTQDANDRPKVDTAPATDSAREWQGWGTALKPSWEPIIVARKPLAGTVAENVQRFGTGGINVDGCRVAGEVPQTTQGASSRIYGGGKGLCPDGLQLSRPNAQGRWPANLIHDGSDEVVSAFPDAAKPCGSPKKTNGNGGLYEMGSAGAPGAIYADDGSAARFFYCAKASREDREEGNSHPTVKPTALMQYLCRLVTPPGGTVLDMFLGSGSTGKAAVLEGFGFIGIETEQEYIEIARRRIERAWQDKQSEIKWDAPAPLKQRELIGALGN